MDLETGRLRLVRFAGEHLAFLHALWTDREVRRFLWDDRSISRHEAAEVIEASEECFRERGFGFWVLVERSPGQPVGFAGLRSFGETDEVEILYGLAPEVWQRGLATEAADRVLRYAFEEAGLEEVFAGADPPNRASFRVMQRLGFEPHSRRVIGGLEADYQRLSKARFLDLRARSSPSPPSGLSPG